MTAVTSESKKSFFGVHFRNKLAENKRLLIVNIVLQLIGLPLMIAFIIYSEYTYANDLYSPDESILGVSTFAIMICIFSGMLIARNSFSYLFTKTLVDMNYSLPLTAKQKFFCEYLSGLTVYIGPAFLSGIVSLIVLVAGTNMFDVEFDWEVFPEILKIGLIILVGIILYYTLTVFATVCTGSSFESVFGTFALNMLIPAVIACTSTVICESAGFGFWNETVFENTLFTSTSPIGVLCYIVIYADSVDYGYGSSFAAYGFMRWLLLSLFVLAVFIIGSYLLYKHRKAESVSQPYVYKLFNHIIMIVGIYCILSLFIVYSEAVGTGIVICGIIYFILEVISRRGFRRFWVSIVKFGATVAAVFVLCNVCMATEGFGVGKHVPNASMVDSVSIQLYGSAYYIDANTVFKDKNVIEETVAAHEKIVDRFYNPDDYEDVSRSPEYYENSNIYYDYTTVHITYHMKSGTISSRYYDTSMKELAYLFESILLSDEYAEYMEYELIEEVLNYSSDTYYYDISEKTLEEIKNRRSELSVTNQLLEEGEVVSVKNKDLYRLAEAYAEDMKDMTEDEFEKSPVYGYIFGVDYPVRECFEDTIALIDEMGLTPPEITAETLSENGMHVGIEDNLIINHSVAEPGETDYDEAENYYYSDKRLTAYCDYVHTPEDLYINYSGEDMTLMCEALRKAAPVVIDSEVSGVVYAEPYAGRGGSISFALIKSDENDALIEALKEAYTMNKQMYAPDYDYYD
ncbi:MAG: hypothetical protein E7497_00860 [Ruminococcus sp.]|nr:hypothetical protein [Ruminococcus sp.]